MTEPPPPFVEIARTLGGIEATLTALTARDADLGALIRDLQAEQKETGRRASAQREEMKAALQGIETEVKLNIPAFAASLGQLKGQIDAMQREYILKLDAIDERIGQNSKRITELETAIRFLRWLWAGAAGLVATSVAVLMFIDKWRAIFGP